MQHITRRSFLGTGLAATTALALPGRVGHAQALGGFIMGAQSYSFRNFDTVGAFENLIALGLDKMEFCSVHFPPDANDPGFDAVKTLLEKSGVTVPCFGVEGFGDDAAANRAKFEFAKALGVGVLTADPTPESFDNLDELCEEFQIKIAIHNHGPKARYDKAADTLKAVEGHHEFIGACVDTGHSIRSAEQPHEVIKALGKRVISLHLKDWIHGGEEQILGKGDMDLVAVARELKALDFKGPVMMEYENSPEGPVPDMQEGWNNWIAAIQKA